MHTLGSKQRRPWLHPTPRCMNLAHPCPCFLKGCATSIINCDRHSESSSCWFCDLENSWPGRTLGDDLCRRLCSQGMCSFFHLCEQCPPHCPSESAPRAGNASLKTHTSLLLCSGSRPLSLRSWPNATCLNEVSFPLSSPWSTVCFYDNSCQFLRFLPITTNAEKQPQTHSITRSSSSHH